jgi:phosphatidylserine decarboxylase
MKIPNVFFASCPDRSLALFRSPFFRRLSLSIAAVPWFSASFLFLAFPLLFAPSLLLSGRLPFLFPPAAPHSPACLPWIIALSAVLCQYNRRASFYACEVRRLMKVFWRLFTELSSRKSISKLAGSLAKSSFSKRWIPSFVKAYNIRVEEAEKPLDEYASLNEFFTRRLKPGMRNIDPDESTLISPVDASIVGLGTVEEGRIINVKGQDYSVDELLNGSPRAVNYKNGFYIVLYLSPSDYHRIHAPVSGTIVEKEYIPGRVYPVNDFGMRNMRKVLSRNERLVTYIQHECGETALVKVGAMNVSAIRYVEPLPEAPEKGQEIAYFEFGSTVVLLMEKGTFRFNDNLHAAMKVQMGDPLGRLHEKTAK